MASLTAVEAIFQAALEKGSAEERSDYLDQACRQDSDLRQQVERLLNAQHQLGSFLEQPAAAGGATRDFVSGQSVDPANPPRLTEGPGSRIGPYKLLQQIGEGGMGVVYMAEQQEPVRRKVALKIIKPGMDSRQVIARFEAERQALALMDHQNIARVLDAGETPPAYAGGSPRPYFVMELVKGVPITKFCDEQHLTPRERLGLFVPVCQAIQHAHQKGIIHRDIKPSNVLVTLYDGKPVPKVIDFGVAKATEQRLTERTLFTQLGQVVGTVEYMSPEQAELNALDIDTRSDIYSLGVLLYELLTGSTPLEKQKLRNAAFSEMLRMIREEEPPRPSTRLSTSGDKLPSISAQRKTEPARLAKLVRGELDWIVMKALEKDRGRRYETANGFARDIQRYLADEPVEACPPSAGYKLRKFARKNCKALATAGAFVLLLVVAAAFSAWQAIRATRAEGKALEAQALETERANAERAARLEETAAKQREEAQRLRAEANFAKARAAVDDYLTKVSESQLLKVPGMQSLRRELLQSALAFYNGFLNERAGDPTIRRDLASAYFRVGRVQRDLGAYTEGNRAINEAVALLDQLVRENPKNLIYKADLARGCFYAGNYAQATALGKQLVAADPTNVRFRSELAEAYHYLGGTVEKENPNAQLKAYQEALNLREALAREQPDNSEVQDALAASLNDIGVALGGRGRKAEARDMYLRANEYERIAFEKAPWNLAYGRGLALSTSNVALMHRHLGQNDEALRWYERAVNVYKQLAENNPAVPRLWASLLDAYETVTEFQWSLNHRAEAIRWQRLARATMERMPKEGATNLYQLARVRARSAGAVGWGKKELTNEEKAQQQREADLAMDALRKAATAGLKNGENLIKNEEDLAILRDRPDYKALLADLPALAQRAEVAKAKAQVASQKQKAVAEPTNRQLQADLAASQHALGMVHLSQGKPDEAAPLVRRALSTRESLVAAEPDNGQWQADLDASQKALAEILAAQGMADEAVKVLQLAVTRRERLVLQEPKNPTRFTHLADIRITRGNVYWRAGRLAEGIQDWQKAAKILETGRANLNADAPEAQQLSSGWDALSKSYVKAGLCSEASACYDRLLKLRLMDDSRFFYALLRLQVGDVAGYRQACTVLRTLMEKELSFRQGGPVFYTWVCALDSQSEVTPEKLVQWAKRQQGIEYVFPAWPEHVLALALYRAGRFQEALGHANHSNAATHWTGRNSNWPILAMAHHRLGHAAQARNWLEQANRDWGQRSPIAQSIQAANVLPVSTDPYFWQGAWHDWLIFEHLLAEANTLILGHRGEADCLELLHEAYLRTKLGDTKKADELFQAAVRGRAKEASAWLARGRVYLLLGDKERAKADFAKALAMKPDDPKIQKEFKGAGGREKGGR